MDASQKEIDMPTDSNVKTQLSTTSLIAYSGLALPISIAELPIILYLPAFYAKEVGLSIGMVGLVFLFARLWDGFSDPVIGILSDRINSPFGRRKPWVIVGAPLLMGATWFLCNPPDQVGFLYLGFWAVLFYTALTIVKIPYWSWGAELSSDYEERSRITGFRESGSMIGNIIVAAAPLLLLPNDAPIRDVLFLITLLIILLLPITIAPLAIAIKDPQRVSTPGFKFAHILSALRQNRPLLLFLIAMICNYVSLGIINSTAIFLIDIGLGLPGAFFSLFFIQYMAAIVSVPILVRLGNRFDKHRVLAGSFAITAIYYLIAFTLPMGSYYLVAGLICIGGITFACAYIFITSILADIVDFDTAVSGEERTGIYMAALNLVMKFGLALGVGLAYGFLDIVGFDPAAATHTAEDVFKIRLVGYGPTSALLIPAFYILWKFPITKTVQRELRRQIEANAGNTRQSSEKKTRSNDKTFSDQPKNKELHSSTSLNSLLPDND